MSHEPTLEQDAFAKDSLCGEKFKWILVQAEAAAGKSTNITNLVSYNPTLRFLGMAFNRKACDELKEKLKHLPNATVHTFDSLSHKYEIENEEKPPRLFLEDIEEWREQIRNKVSVWKYFPWQPFFVGLNVYFESIQWIPQPQHFRHVPLKWIPHMILVAEALMEQMYQGLLPLCYGAVAKFFHISRHSLDEHYDVCVIDEAMDLTPVVCSSLIQLPWSVYVVGDSAQTINGWRGCQDTFVGCHFDRTYRFSVSFRFGNSIAKLRNSFFQEAQYPYPSLRSASTHETKIRTYSSLIPDEHETIEMYLTNMFGEANCNHTYALLSRINSTLMDWLISDGMQKWIATSPCMIHLTLSDSLEQRITQLLRIARMTEEERLLFHKKAKEDDRKDLLDQLNWMMNSWHLRHHLQRILTLVYTPPTFPAYRIELAAVFSIKGAQYHSVAWTSCLEEVFLESLRPRVRSEEDKQKLFLVNVALTRQTHVLTVPKQTKQLFDKWLL